MSDIVKTAQTDKFSISEGFMPNNNVQYNGKLYTLDKEKMKVTLFRYETIDLNECPEPVLKELMKMQAGISVNLDKDRLENE